ncbi:MAG: WD40 repeat domain-containing protein [Planctomycetota bacterium]|nr:WD40 repeat domain-containing protein [Planctomycetota bacterium]
MADTNVDPQQTHITQQWKYDSPLIACRFDPQARYVFSSAQDNSVQRWELSSGNKVVMKAHDSWVRSIAFASDGEQVITGGADDLMWWPVAAAAPEPIRRVEAHDGWIRTMSTSPDGKLLATGANDRLVKLWNTQDGTLVRELPGHEKDVYSTLFHPSGEFLLSGDLAGQVHQWEVATGKLVRKFDATQLHTYNEGQGVDFGGVRTLALSPDMKHLACGGLHKATNPLGAVNEPLVLVYEWESQKLVQSHVAEGLKGVAWRVIFHPGEFLCGATGGSSGGFLLFWKTAEPKDFHRLKMPHQVRDLDMHPDGMQLATTHYDSHLRISRMTAKEA